MLPAAGFSEWTALPILALGALPALGAPQESSGTTRTWSYDTLFAGVVGTLGDLDGDAHAEFLVGSAYEVAVFSGATCVRLGVGPWPGARTIGDLDGDGFQDFVSPGTGAPVVSGKTFETLRIFAAPEGAGSFGFEVAPAGDWDRDGLPDVLVGAPHTGLPGLPRAGAAWIFSGRTGEVLQAFFGSTAGEGLGAFLDAHLLHDDARQVIAGGWRGFASYELRGDAQVSVRHVRFQEPAAVWTRLPVAITEDLDADGRLDVVVASCGKDAARCVQVLSGADGRVIHEIRPTADTSQAKSTFGYAVSCVGDFDGDGTADLAIGDPDWVGRASLGNGRVHVYSGRDGHTLLTRAGEEYYGVGFRLDGYGCALSGAGDVNGDGHADFIVGVGRYLAPGIAHVFSGKDRSLICEVEGFSANDAEAVGADPQFVGPELPPRFSWKVLFPPVGR